MKRALLIALAALLLAGCATQGLRQPCTHPAFAPPSDDCGPLKRFP